MPCRVLLDQVAEAYATGDAATLKALYAEDALVCSAAAPDVVLGRDAVFERDDLLHRTSLVGPLDLIPIDETAGMIRATVRIQTPEGHYQSGERVWLLAFKEGLIHRQRVLESREGAADIYQRHGTGLGIEAPGDRKEAV